MFIVYIYGADIIRDWESLRVLSLFTRWMQNSARRMATFGPNRRIWAIGPPLGGYETTSTIAIYYYSALKLILSLPSHIG